MLGRRRPARPADGRAVRSAVRAEPGHPRHADRRLRRVRRRQRRRATAERLPVPVPHAARPVHGRAGLPVGRQITPARTKSVTALQALAMLNNAFVVRQRRAPGDEAEPRSGDDSRRRSELAFAWRWPSRRRRRSGAVERRTRAKHGLANVCRVLLNATSSCSWTERRSESFTYLECLFSTLTSSSMAEDHRSARHDSRDATSCDARRRPGRRRARAPAGAGGCALGVGESAARLNGGLHHRPRSGASSSSS